MNDNWSPEEQNNHLKWLFSFISENKLSFLFALLGFFALLTGVFIFVNTKDSRQEGIEIISDENQQSSLSSQKSIFVEVSGEVKNPGVYEMSIEDRVFEALNKAGGFTENADTAFVDKVINKAAKLVDGQKIYIPKAGKQSEVLSANNSSVNKSDQTVSTSLVNINTDSLQKLDSLPGIGPTYAQRIIDQRPYSSIEELKSKKVIPNSVFEKIKDKVTVY
ncbi:MAG: helix-hairpin-helix domain-containing protein [Patescibacteria group bacterium]|nr:helix-hairpin-helix domain-containing protein [Patescibacteria group bacterium]